MLENKCQLCLKYLLKGCCFTDCKFKDTHHKLQGKDITATSEYIKKPHKWNDRQGLSSALPFPRIPPDKTDDNCSSNRKKNYEDLIPNSRKDGEDESLGRRREITGLANIPQTLVGRFKDHQMMNLYTPDPPNLPDPADNVTINPETCHLFNDTEAIPRLSYDLESTRPFCRLHYEPRQDTYPNSMNPRPPEKCRHHRNIYSRWYRDSLNPAANYMSQYSDSKLRRMQRSIVWKYYENTTSI